MATKAKNAKIKYDSNPFTLAFSALSRLFKTNLGWAIVLFIFTLGGAYSQGFSNSSDKSKSAGGDIFSSIDPSIIVLIAVLVFLLIIAVILIGIFISGMIAYVTNCSEKGYSVSFSDTFYQTKIRFRRLFWAQTLATLKILAWSLLLIVPGIIASLRYSILSYLIMDESEKERGIIDSHNKTKAIIKGRLWEAFGVSTVSTVIPFVGPLLGITGRGALYRQLQYSHTHKSRRPKVHWLNYLGLWLIGAAILLICLIIILIILIAAKQP